MPEQRADYSPGLEGIIAGETAICHIGDDGLHYRGYFIGELAEKCSFEEIAYLLLRGELPDRKGLESFAEEVAFHRTPPARLLDMVRGLPRDIHPMDALRSAVSLQSHFDPEVGDGSP